MQERRVGFVGLGMQGAPIAGRIIDAGHPTTLYARREASLEPFRSTPAEVASTLGELGARCDVVGVCVMDDAQLDEVLLGDDAILAGMAARGAEAVDRTVIVHSTVHPDTVRRIAARAAGQGVELLDAPVSGGPVAAEQGMLCVMVGGETATFERCRDLLETFGNPVRHLGPVGAGQQAKLLNNLLFTAQLALARDIGTIGDSLGIDARALADTLLQGSARSYALDVWSNTGSFELLAASAGPRLEKDVDLVLEVGRDAGIADTLVGKAAVRMIEVFNEVARA
jgi:3-hydroxyisobutyrate dehydrogenase